MFENILIVTKISQEINHGTISQEFYRNTISVFFSIKYFCKISISGSYSSLQARFDKKNMGTIGKCEKNKYGSAFQSFQINIKVIRSFTHFLWRGGQGRIYKGGAQYVVPLL